MKYANIALSRLHALQETCDSLAIVRGKERCRQPKPEGPRRKKAVHMLDQDAKTCPKQTKAYAGRPVILVYRSRICEVIRIA
jgi:hypothetical protein